MDGIIIVWISQQISSKPQTVSVAAYSVVLTTLLSIKPRAPSFRLRLKNSTSRLQKAPIIMPYLADHN